MDEYQVAPSSSLKLLKKQLMKKHKTKREAAKTVYCIATNGKAFSVILSQKEQRCNMPYQSQLVTISHNFLESDVSLPY